MKIIYVDKKTNQLGASISYDFASVISVGDIICADKLWNQREMKIAEIKITGSVIFCFLRNFKKR